MQPSLLRSRPNASRRRDCFTAERLEPRRLLSIGDLDVSYGDGGAARISFLPNDDGLATAVEALPDGRAYVAAWQDTGSFSVARLTYDGDLDPTFGSGGTARVHVGTAQLGDQTNVLVVQPDGKVIVGGNAFADFGLARFLPDGTLDPTFGDGGTIVTRATAFPQSIGAQLSSLLLQADGKILAVGGANNGNHVRAAAVRYNPDGTLDPTFGTNGIAVYDLSARFGQLVDGSAFSDGVALSDGSFLLSGSVSGGALVKLTPAGQLDTSFADGGVARDATFTGVGSITPALDGGYYTVVVVPGNAEYNAAVAHWNADGTLDSTFGTAGTALLTTGSYAFSDVEAQSDGTIVASAGFSRNTSSAADHGFEWAVFSASGQRVAGGQWWSSLYSLGGGGIALQPDGRALLLAGSLGGGSLPTVFRYRTMPDDPKGVRIDAGIIFVTGDDNPDLVSVSRDADNWLILLDGQPYTFPASAASRVDTRLFGGTDSITIGADVPPGMFDLGSGEDTADLLSPVARGLGGDDSDTFRFAARQGPTLTTGILPGGDSDLLQVSGTDGPDTFSILNGALELPGWRVNFNGELERAAIDALGGDDTVTLDILPSYRDEPDPVGPAVVVNGGDGSDTFDTHRGPGIALQEFHGGPGDDRMNVFPDYRTDLAFEGGPGDDRVTYGPFPSGSLSLSNSQVVAQSLGGSLKFLDPAGVEALRVIGTGGAGTARYLLTRSAPGVPTTILGGEGADTLVATVQLPGGFAAMANVTFDGGGDTAFTDSVEFRDSSSGAHRYVIGGTTAARDGVTGPHYTGVSSVLLVGGDGGNHFTVSDAEGLSSLSIKGGRGPDVFDTAPGAGGLGARPGATVTFTGGLVTSDSGADLYRVRPDATAQFLVWGDVLQITNPPPYSAGDTGDRLEVDTSSTTGANLSITGRGSGTYSFADRQPVRFFDIESLNDVISTLSPVAGFLPGPPRSATFAFTGDVSRSVSPDDLRVTNLTTGEQVTPTNASMSLSPDGTTVTFVLDRLTEGRLPGGQYRAALPAGSVAIAGPTGPAALATDVSVDFSQGAAVTGAWVDGTSWPAAFRDRLRASGLVSAADALLGLPVDLATALSGAALPWANVDRFSVRFDAPVEVDAADLRVQGIRVPSPRVASFSYEPLTRTATWTLSRPVPDDYVGFIVAGSLAGGVALRGSSPPVLLDGEFTGTYPTGNGKPGGDFAVAPTFLTGDVTRDGRVNATDLLLIRSRMGIPSGGPTSALLPADLFCDINTDGRVDVLDYQLARARQSSVAITATPAATATTASTSHRRLAPLPREILS